MPFVYYIRLIISADFCHEVMTVPGPIASKHNYDPDSRCQWLIKAELGTLVKLDVSFYIKKYKIMMSSICQYLASYNLLCFLVVC